MSLTESDRELIRQAREVGPALRASTGDRDRLAGWLLKELADLAERLGDDPELYDPPSRHHCKACQAETGFESPPSTPRAGSARRPRPSSSRPGSASWAGRSWLTPTRSSRLTCGASRTLDCRSASFPG